LVQCELVIAQAGRRPEITHEMPLMQIEPATAHQKPSMVNPDTRVAEKLKQKGVNDQQKKAP